LETDGVLFKSFFFPPSHVRRVREMDDKYSILPPPSSCAINLVLECNIMYYIVLC